jgi:hypothetical protein
MKLTIVCTALVFATGLGTPRTAEAQNWQRITTEDQYRASIVGRSAPGSGTRVSGAATSASGTIPRPELTASSSRCAATTFARLGTRAEGNPGSARSARSRPRPDERGPGGPLAGAVLAPAAGSLGSRNAP